MLKKCKNSTEKIVREIKRKTRRSFSSEEKYYIHQNHKPYCSYIEQIFI